MDKNSLKLIRPMVLIFIMLSALFIIGSKTLAGRGADPEVLIVGNLLVFLVSFAAFLISYKALQSPNPQAFMRSMYLSFIIKFFVIAIAAFVYIQVEKKAVNKTSLFACMGLYLVYTFMEVSALMKLLKQKKNA